MAISASRDRGKKRKGRGRSSLGGFDATLDEQTALDQYLRDVSRHELITPDKEKELGALAQAGDEGAVQELARANLRFVISVAKKYQNRGVSLTDLIQEGNVGLVTAARKFDPEQGVKFISYAVWWIRQAILAALANHGRSVRVPLNRASDLARIFREKERLKQELGRDPNPEELSAATDLTPELIESLQTLNAAEIRLDAPIGDSEDSQLVERFINEEAAEPEQDVEMRLLAEAVSGALDTLEARDARVLRLYFGLDGEREHTLEEIGNMLGVTRERIRQLRDRALRRLCARGRRVPRWSRSPPDSLVLAKQGRPNRPEPLRGEADWGDSFSGFQVSVRPDSSVEPRDVGRILEGTGGVYRIAMSEGGEVVEASLRGRLKYVSDTRAAVVGDLVVVSKGGRGQGQTIEEVLPRRNQLERAAPGGRRSKVVAANLDRVLVVLSALEPAFDSRTADRFLVLAETCGIPPVLILNKMDLREAPSVGDRVARVYEGLGYPVLRTSALSREGLDRLEKLFEKGVSALVGPSGVGKSSIMNALFPELELRTGGLTGRGRRGRHTTVGARLIRVTEEGWVADTPGFSDVGLWGVEQAELSQAFPEFREPSKHCRFRGCTHSHEPDCGVSRALEEGGILRERYDSYRAFLMEG